MKTELRRIRESKGLSLRDLGEKTGIAYTRIWRHEQRTEKLYPRDISRYGEALGVEPEEIRGEDGFAKLPEGADRATFLVTQKALDDGIPVCEGEAFIGWLVEEDELVRKWKKEEA